MVPQLPVLRVLSWQIEEAKYSPKKFLVWFPSIGMYRGKVILEIIGYPAGILGDNERCRGQAAFWVVKGISGLYDMMGVSGLKQVRLFFLPSEWPFSNTRRCRWRSPGRVRS